MIGIFVFGCFITAIVAMACWLVITGIREDQRSREGLPDDGTREPRPSCASRRAPYSAPRPR